MKRLANGRWQIRWRDRDGVQRAKNFKNKERAREWERHHDPDAPTFKQMTFGDLADKWLREYSGVEKAKSAAKADEVVIRVHLRPAFGNRLITELRKSHLLDLRASLRLEGRAAKTVNNIMAIAKTMMTTAVSWELLAASPWTDVKPLKVIRKAFAFWTAEERDRFLAACRKTDPTFAELVMVASHTGLRKGELQALQCSQLDFQRRLIRVDATYCHTLKERLERTKNGEVGFVPMDAEVFEALKSRRLQHGATPVFTHAMFMDAGPRLGRRCKTAGVTVLRFHDLRHTAASVWVMAGVPLYTVQRMMRHKSITMTERYAHLAPGYLQEAAETAVHGKVHSLRKANAST